MQWIAARFINHGIELCAATAWLLSAVSSTRHVDAWQHVRGTDADNAI
jgi:hypothetical protein